MKFRKKPIVIEAKKVLPETEDEIIKWAHEGLHPMANIIIARGIGGLRIRTLEGSMYAQYGWWIAKGIMGEFYPISPDIF